MGIETLEGFLDLAGLAMSIVLVLIALWGVFSFFPRKDVRGNNAASWLILAIWLGFMAIAANTLYWRVLGDFAVRYEWIAKDTVNYFGRMVGDFVWKGLSIAAIYLHFFARWKAIPKEEQHNWSPMLMGFYPDSTQWAVRTFTRMQVILRIKKPKGQ